MEGLSTKHYSEEVREVCVSVNHRDFRGEIGERKTLENVSVESLSWPEDEEADGIRGTAVISSRPRSRFRRVVRWG